MSNLYRALINYFTADEDYTSNSLSKTFDASTNTLCIGVPIEDDDIAESIEFFDLLLSSSDPAVIITRPKCPVAIVNNDSKQSLSYVPQHAVWVLEI